MGNGVISEDALAQKLLASKKIMDMEKKPVSNGRRKQPIVEDFEYEDEEKINFSFSDPNGLLESIPETKNLTKVYPQPTIDKIKNSKLPDNVKQIMIDHPIIQPELSLTETLDIKLVEKAKRLMEQDNPSPNKQTKSRPMVQQPQVGNNVSITEIVTALTPIIENTMRKLFDEKLTQILTANEIGTVNESLVLKVGDSIFKGKITGVKPSK